MVEDPIDKKKDPNLFYKSMSPLILFYFIFYYNFS